MEYFPDKKEIILNRELSELDRFVFDFVEILREHARYVIMSGYVSIILGRSRSTEDIDLFLEKIEKNEFVKLYNNLEKNNFWCLNSSDVDGVFDYLKNGFAVRFAEKGTAIPNFKIKFPKCKLDEETFTDAVKVKLKVGGFLISSPERHIAFKRIYLGSDKDEEYVLHAAEILKNKNNLDKIGEIEKQIK